MRDVRRPRDSLQTRESQYAQASGTLHRIAADRILVRRLAGSETLELSGPAAVVWAALIEPGSASDVRLRLGDAGVEAAVGDVIDALRQLTEEQLVVQVE